jgi:hypothetical protein
MEHQTLTKTCTKCGVCQPLDNFYKVKRTKPKVRNVPHDDHKAMCKSCYKARAAEWVKNNPEKRRAIARKWDEANSKKRKEAFTAHNKKPEVKERMRQWRLANATAYMRNRRANDQMYAFKIKIRGMLRKAFDRNGYTKRSKTNDILGCTWAEFMLHIERQFQPGMTWLNRGDWHIDHIVPLATAKTEDDVIKLNHYTNLRPLWAEDNLRKSDKMEHLL